MKGMHMLAFVLVIVGALNWGLVGLGNFSKQEWDLVEMLLGQWETLRDVVYVLVGLSAIVLVADHKRNCRACSTGMDGGM